MKAILFDFGGTIDTDGVHWSEKFWELYERYKVGVSKKDFEKAFVQSEAELLKDLDIPQATFYETLQKQLRLQFAILAVNGKADLLQHMADACYEDVQERISKARTLLVKLQREYVFGVVSNFYGNLEVVCKEFQLDSLVGVMIDSQVVGVRKPDPKIIQLALEKLGVDAGNAIVVGDSYERDIVPGKELGCKTVWLKGKNWTLPTPTEKADHTIERFADLEGLLINT